MHPKGGLLTLFLHSPLTAICVLGKIKEIPYHLWETGQAFVDRFLAEASRLLTRVKGIGNNWTTGFSLKWRWCDPNIIWFLLQSHPICLSLATTSYGYCYCVSSSVAWPFAFTGPLNIGLLYCPVRSPLFPKASCCCKLRSNGPCIRWSIIWNSVPFL